MLLIFGNQLWYDNVAKCKTYLDISLRRWGGYVVFNEHVSIPIRLRHTVADHVLHILQITYRENMFWFR